MNICFLMYPWEEIDPENDTSLALIHECVKTQARCSYLYTGKSHHPK